MIRQIKFSVLVAIFIGYDLMIFRRNRSGFNNLIRSDISDQSYPQVLLIWLIIALVAQRDPVNVSGARFQTEGVNGA